MVWTKEEAGKKKLLSPEGYERKDDECCSCDDCKFFFQNEEMEEWHKGQCRRNPPSVEYPSFPSTCEHDWCGEFRLRTLQKMTHFDGINGDYK